MGKKKNKGVKKLSAKKEKYLKFRKEKPSIQTFASPELNEDQVKDMRESESRLNQFLRFNKNKPTKEVNERRMKSKR